ncbi:hypothetical protein QYF61_023695 [Mycteria americana]|uniref:Uncharacterized protein n=1 Tax=Mycteria americana TaxID=33587 RepID=A0AAN7MSP3_MYCAM|nr:hypothetical protein QYF61_023695 [Mycteria americana]
MSLSTTPAHLLNTSRDGDSAPSLGRLFQCLTTLSSKPPLAQLEAISSCPMACYLGEETNTHLAATSFQIVVESDKVSPQPPFLQAKQPQVPQPLPISLVFQTLPQLRCPSLDTLQPLNVSLVVRGPSLNTVFEVQPHQCQVQGGNHFPSPAGHTIPDTSQDAIGLLGRLGTLLAHIQLAVDQHSQLSSHSSPSVAWGCCDPSAGPGTWPYTIGLGPLIQPLWILLQSLPTLKQINTPAQLGVVCKVTEGALNPLVQIIDKDIKQNWPQHRALGNTTCDRPPTGFNSIHHHSLDLAIQPDCLPRDPVNQSPKQAKVCPPEVQGGSCADSPPYFSKNQKLYHITRKSFPVHKQQETTSKNSEKAETEGVIYKAAEHHKGMRYSTGGEGNIYPPGYEVAKPHEYRNPYNITPCADTET